MTDPVMEQPKEIGEHEHIWQFHEVTSSYFEHTTFTLTQSFQFVCECGAFKNVKPTQDLTVYDDYDTA